MNTPIGGGSKNGSKSGKNKGKYPSKTTINLLYKEKHTAQNIFSLVLFEIFLVALGFFTKYLVIDQIEKVNEAEAVYNSYQNQLDMLRENNADYTKVQDEYSHYGNGYLNEEESPLQDRQKMIDVINQKVQIDSGITSITIDGNTATVEIESVLLKEVSSVVANLESSDIVSYVGVQTAGTGEGGETVVASSSGEGTEQTPGIVQATLTIEFKAAGPAAETKSDSETESLTDQLAADKERAEQTGEEE